VFSGDFDPPLKWAISGDTLGLAQNCPRSIFSTFFLLRGGSRAGSGYQAAVATCLFFQ